MESQILFPGYLRKSIQQQGQLLFYDSFILCLQLLVHCYLVFGVVSISSDDASLATSQLDLLSFDVFEPGMISLFCQVKKEAISFHRLARIKHCLRCQWSQCDRNLQ